MAFPLQMLEKEWLDEAAMRSALAELVARKQAGEGRRGRRSGEGVGPEWL